jgi:putative flippase GtrA
MLLPSSENRPDWFRAIYELHGEKLRYLVVGMFNTAFGYGMFIAMLAVFSPLHVLAGSTAHLLAIIGKNYFLLAQWSSWVLAVPVGTMTMKFVVFRSKGHWLHEIGKAYFVYLPGLAISSGILWVTVQLLRLPPQIGQLVTIAVATVFSYLGHKYFTFRVQPEEPEGRLPSA